MLGLEMPRKVAGCFGGNDNRRGGNCSWPAASSGTPTPQQNPPHRQHSLTTQCCTQSCSIIHNIVTVETLFNLTI